MKRKQMFVSRVVALFALALLLIQCASGTRSVEGTAPAAPEVTDLTNVEPVRQAFQRDQGTVRLVTLLSPV